MGGARFMKQTLWVSMICFSGGMNCNCILLPFPSYILVVLCNGLFQCVVLIQSLTVWSRNVAPIPPLYHDNGVHFSLMLQWIWYTHQFQHFFFTFQTLTCKTLKCSYLASWKEYPNKSVQILPFKNFTMYHMLNKSLCMVIPT